MYPNISDGTVLTGFSMNSSFVPLFGAGGDFVQANLNQPFRFGNASAHAGTIISALSANGINVSSKAVQDIVSEYDVTDYVAGLTPPQQVPYVNGYLANKDDDSQQYLFFQPGHFDTGLLYAGEQTKQPVTVGELLTLGSLPMVNDFAGPVLIITGCKYNVSICVSDHAELISANDLPYCGGNCLATGNPDIPSIPAAAMTNFPKVATSNFEAYIQPNTGHGLNFHYNQTGSYEVINDFLASKGL